MAKKNNPEEVAEATAAEAPAAPAAEEVAETKEAEKEQPKNDAVTESLLAFFGKMNKKTAK